MLVAIALVPAAAAGYALLCAASPFRPSGRLRLGRRALNAWRRTHHDGAR